ncbi:Fc.00g110310.m01.CDS01 [Cosmosporella sp. VM-42]
MEESYGVAYTERVVAATGNDASLRVKEVMASLIRHLHDFAREVNLTSEELFVGIDLINQCGQKSDSARNETQLLGDILGLESLVDRITSRLVSTASQDHTPSTILGPFYRPNAPVLPPGSSIISPGNRAAYISSTTYLSGRVLAPDGTPVSGAIVDIWHTAPNGMYEQQDATQPDMDLRGRFATDAAGNYSLYCLRPVAYPIPSDGPVGKLLAQLHRHPYRPAHIHFIISAPGYHPLTTQLFDGADEWLRDDAVFAVKRELIVKFQPRDDDPDARWTLAFDFILAKDDE